MDIFDLWPPQFVVEEGHIIFEVTKKLFAAGGHHSSLWFMNKGHKILKVIVLLYCQNAWISVFLYKLLSGHNGLRLLWSEATAFEMSHIEVILWRKSLQFIMTGCNSILKVTG